MILFLITVYLVSRVLGSHRITQGFHCGGEKDAQTRIHTLFLSHKRSEEGGHQPPNSRDLSTEQLTGLAEEDALGPGNLSSKGSTSQRPTRMAGSGIHLTLLFLLTNPQMLVHCTLKFLIMAHIHQAFCLPQPTAHFHQVYHTQPSPHIAHRQHRHTLHPHHHWPHHPNLPGSNPTLSPTQNPGHRTQQPPGSEITSRPRPSPPSQRLHNSSSKLVLRTSTTTYKMHTLPFTSGQAQGLHSTHTPQLHQCTSQLPSNAGPLTLPLPPPVPAHPPPPPSLLRRHLKHSTLFKLPEHTGSKPTA